MVGKNLKLILIYTVWYRDLYFLTKELQILIIILFSNSGKE